MSAHAYTEDQLVEQPASGTQPDFDWTAFVTAHKLISQVSEPDYERPR